MHIKMYPLDQVSESLILNCFLLEYGDNKEFSFGRCKQGKSFNDLFEELKNIE